MRTVFSCVLFFVFLLCCNAQSRGSKSDFSGKRIPVVAAPVRVAIPADADTLGSFCCSLLDADSNLWFGTTGAGIYKWNGTSFTQYGAENGLGNQYVNCLMQDDYGIIWVGTDSGVYSLHNNRFEYERFTGISDKKFTVHKIVQSGNDLWFASEQYGLWKKNGRIVINFDPLIEIDPEFELENYQVRGGYWFIVPVDSMGVREVHESAIQDVYVRSRYGIWISTVSHGLFSLTNGIFTPRGDVDAVAMLETRSGDFWIGTRTGGVCRYNSGGMWTCFNPFGTEGNAAMCMTEDNNQRMWIGSVGSFAQPARSGIVSCRIPQEHTNKKDPVFSVLNTSALKSNRVCTVIEDAHGDLWIGTSGFGLYRYDRRKGKQQFVSYAL